MTEQSDEMRPLCDHSQSPDANTWCFVCRDCYRKAQKELDRLELENKSLRLLDEKREQLEADKKELIEALSDMVAQHCYIDDAERKKDIGDKADVESNCLHANADAMRLLGKLGVLELDDRGMRVVFGKWPRVEDKK